MTYYNTTHSHGAELHTFREKAASQEEAILRVFRDTGIEYTPSEMWARYFPGYLLQSIRRAMTNLTQEDPPKLEKTTVQRKGPYGRPEYVWRAVTHQLRLIL